MKKYSNNLAGGIKKGVRGTFTFYGKSNQFEFITYFVLTVIVYYGGTILLFSLFETALESIVGPLMFFWYILAILIAISQLANGARRLEDMDVNKWALLIGFIQIIGLYFVLYLCVTPSAAKKRKK